jgi:two-component system cell cycle sensor histidine kinase/response regulator CckA
MGANRAGHVSQPMDPLLPTQFCGPWKSNNVSNFKQLENLALAKDRTEKKHLEETSKRLSSALDQVMEVIAILDAREGFLLYSNTTFSQVFGCPGPPASKQKFMDLFECRILTTALEQARLGQAWTGRSSLKVHTGKRITFEGTVSPVRHDEGAVESLVVRLRDITLEVEKDAQLRQAHKMDALGALAGGMAHDFNNLIGAILNAAELIDREVPQDSPIHRKLQIIQQVGGRARDLSAQILNFSRRTDDLSTAFDLTSLVSEVITVLQTTLPKNVDVRTDLARAIRMRGNPSQLHQVIMNLGINASQAMQPEGGVLSIRLQPVEAGRRDGDQPFPEPCVLLSIEDTGCGMDQPTLERIFEPFFTTKAMGHGTGLGLSVVYGIVQGHGGSLKVSSEPGKGSSFHICLPLLQETPQGLEPRFTESRLAL